MGGALGDALGAPLEFLDLAEIRRRYGSHGLEQFVPAYGRVGAITDDTQMTLFTAEGLIAAWERGRERGIWHPPSMVHEAYLRWLMTQGERRHVMFDALPGGGLLDMVELHERRGPGRTCLTALMSDRMGTISDPINDSKGCGGIMRIAPVGLALPSRAFDWGCEIAAITHGHPSGYIAAGFFAEAISRILRGAELREAIDGALPLLAAWEGHQETLSAIEGALRAADRGDEPSAEQVERLGEGWVAEEALAISLYCALVARDFRHGIALAANHSGDSDSTAALTGNLLGVRWGVEALPKDLLAQLELRETIEGLAVRLYECFGAA